MDGSANKKNRSQLVTAALIVLVIVLMGSTFYISSTLLGSDQNGKNSSGLAPKKTKASNVTYSKLIALNNVTPTSVPTMEVTPTQGVSPTITVSETPSPTEIILARSPSITEGLSASGAATPTVSVSPTRIVSLPKTGIINNALIIFSLSLLVIFFSFLF